ncbi:MAG: hypothetical protein H6916_05530 [Novosphingobium sp.]|uniref:hypothetical protein n=1 Tax=Novosphingobium sp. TaxID=1874826 RepID=UPI00260F8176|nr:hypothetical protein [Novosphingobium sp.]MCP5386264.1 hypothetical protein [Novosphingobium sp.]
MQEGTWSIRKLRAAVGAFCVLLGLATAPVAQAQNTDDQTIDAQASSPPPGAVGGMGDLNLYPKRIVIDGRQRIATVGLYNKSVATGNYEIAVNDMMMLADGRLVNLEQVSDPAERARVKAASEMLRWSPRRVSLHGNEAQTIRIMARTPPGLEAGEYRSHFVAISVPPADEVGFSIENAVTGSSGPDIGVKIVPRFGISIPIILRVGETTLTSGMRDARVVTLPGGQLGISVTITREGTRSSFGDVAVTARGADQPIALAKGVGVYPEVNSREVTMPVDPEVDTRFLQPGATLTVTYTDDDYEPGATLFSQDFVVQ